mmetsp:Transcript_118599/g.342975  ORF Transcript_118599/g.342975 Transcript_118599/m.342975 type:complete len:205 (+) Transcript_118599:567-1181(+)
MRKESLVGLGPADRACAVGVVEAPLRKAIQGCPNAWHVTWRHHVDEGITQAAARAEVHRHIDHVVEAAEPQLVEHLREHVTGHPGGYISQHHSGSHLLVGANCSFDGGIFEGNDHVRGAPIVARRSAGRLEFHRGEVLLPSARHVRPRIAVPVSVLEGQVRPAAPVGQLIEVGCIERHSVEAIHGRGWQTELEVSFSRRVQHAL